MEHEILEHEHATLKTVLEALERGKPLRESDMTDEQLKVTRSFRLFGEKPRVVIFNTADDETNPDRFTAFATPETPVLAVPAGLELELARMSPEDRAEFQAEMGVGGTDRDALIRTLLRTSRQRLFLTAGEKEVRTWMLHEGGTALDAAASIHTDLAKGFIRAEIFDYRDLMKLGGEREVKAAHIWCGKSPRATSSKTTTSSSSTSASDRGSSSRRLRKIRSAAVTPLVRSRPGLLYYGTICAWGRKEPASSVRKFLRHGI